MSLGNYLWSHIADLVFDCYYVVNLTRERKRRFLLRGLKDCATFLGQTARHGLRPSSVGRVGERGLLQIRHFLDEMRHQLRVANGLGALSDSLYEQLDGRTHALVRAFNNPRVSALFQGGPVPAPHDCGALA